YLTGKSQGLLLNDQAAKFIYAGIVGDTGRFLYPSTTTRTFNYASELVSYNFDRTELYDGMYNVKQHIARLRGYVLSNFNVSESGFTSIKLTEERLQEYGVTALESGQLVGVLGDIQGIKVWAFFVEENPGLIRVRLRSKGPIINEIASRYGGGGHPLASGATVYSWEEADRLMAELDQAA